MVNFISYCYLLSSVIILLTFNVCPQQNERETRMEIKIESRAFKQGELIPSIYSCEGQNISPQLSWKCSVEGVKTFVIIIEDPDAPSGSFTHWVVYNIPAKMNSLMENITPTKNIPDEILMGTNDFGRIGYGGPCPPSGTHRYFFRIYGLDTAVHLDSGATKKEVMIKMQGHIKARGELMGKYKKHS
jgi:Raf kinase inhibitor-like YbhB/YbcL family protein